MLAERDQQARVLAETEAPVERAREQAGKEKVEVEAESRSFSSNESRGPTGRPEDPSSY